MKFFLAIILLHISSIVHAQSVGIGVPAPVETVEVNGNLKTNGLVLSYGGFPFDFLTKIVPDGTIGFKKGHGGMGINFIICVSGIYPDSTGNPNTGGFMGEIKAFVGDFAPTGWRLCHGQHLKDSIPNTALFSLIGRTFGGTDSTFALPDMRGVVPVGIGTHPGGLSWTWGQKSN